MIIPVEMIAIKQINTRITLKDYVNNVIIIAKLAKYLRQTAQRVIAVPF